MAFLVLPYADHAAVLGQENDEIYASLQDKLSKLTDKNLSLQDRAELAIDTGKMNLLAMELLDAGNTTHLGHRA